MIDQFNTLIPEEFRNEQKEIIEEYSYHNEQNNNFTTKDDLEIIQFLQSPGWSLISQNDVNLPLINQTINSINAQENQRNKLEIKQGEGKEKVILIIRLMERIVLIMFKENFKFIL